MDRKHTLPHHQTILDGLNSVSFSVQTSRGEVDEQLANFIPEIGTRQFLMKGLYRKEEGGFGWRYNISVLEKAIDQGNIIGAIPDEEVDIATLFIRGGKSNYILDEDFDAIQNQFTESTIETIENSGHWVHAETPQEFYTKLEAFIAY